jgi:two-component system sensor histidine kinase AlgZ
MSKTGAVETPAADRTPRTTLMPPPRASAAADAPRPREAERALDTFFIPDLCAPRMVLAVVLVAELVALTLALARSDAPFLTELARMSLFLQWLGLTNAALLCYSRKWLARLTVPQSSAAAFALIVLNTIVISEFSLWLGTAFGSASRELPSEHLSFLLRNAGIAVIVAALLLRYFFVTHQWQTHVRAEALSRIQALQARIRPHFLFNSMNTIAALTRSDPKRARRPVPRDLARLAQPVAAQRGAGAHPHLPAHRGAALRRPPRGDVGRRLAADAGVRAWAHDSAAARECDLSRHRAARARRYRDDLGARRRRGG